MGPSQLLPPKTTVSRGLRRLSSRARASEGTFCMNVVVNPTTSGSRASISVAHSATNAAACARIANAVSTAIPCRRA
ncbi:hypothetical protein ABIE67_008491 [Streptomyces sp. V4I8]